MKESIKELIKSFFFAYKTYRTKKYYYKTVKVQISKSEEEIKHLTKEKKRIIKDYWNQYDINVPLQWHKLLFSKTGVEHPDFVPEIVFHLNIKPYMNDEKLAGVWGDKCYLDKFIVENTPKTVVRNVSGHLLDINYNLISIDKAQTIVNEYHELVIKPSLFTHTGKGVKLISGNKDMEKIVTEYRNNFVMQLPVCQHKEFSNFNESSVNTIRMNTVLLGTDVYVMSSFIKVGQAGEFADNSGTNRYFIGIREDGTFMDYAIDHNLMKYTEIPSGFCFANKKVPFYDKLCEAVERAHKYIPHFGFVFWDVCVDEEGNCIIIEANLRNPDTTIPQAAGVRFLGKYTEKIMDYICYNKIETNMENQG